MTTSYNRIAGGALERLAALSDGLFAIAMTLIVLEIHVPAHELITSEPALWAALRALLPRAITYLLSFMTLGIFWVGQQTQFNHFTRADRRLTWIHLGFLAVVAAMPFVTELLAEFITFRTALLAYWVTILSLGMVLYASWCYAERNQLLAEEARGEVSAAIKKRIVRAQLLYAFGAMLCVFSTYASIAVFVAVQLNYAITPSRWLSRYTT